MSEKKYLEAESLKETMWKNFYAEEDKWESMPEVDFLDVHGGCPRHWFQLGFGVALDAVVKADAVPQEMSAREYEEAFHRIAYEDVETYRVWWEAIHDEDWGRAVAIVEEWAKEHPKKKRKTYAEDFREHFNREWNDGTSKDIPFFLCRNQLYKGQYCDMHSSKAVNYKACAECWNAEMEEEK